MRNKQAARGRMPKEYFRGFKMSDMVELELPDEARTLAHGKIIDFDKGPDEAVAIVSVKLIQDPGGEWVPYVGRDDFIEVPVSELSPATSTLRDRLRSVAAVRNAQFEFIPTEDGYDVQVDGYVYTIRRDEKEKFIERMKVFQQLQREISDHALSRQEYEELARRFGVAAVPDEELGSYADKYGNYDFATYFFQNDPFEGYRGDPAMGGVYKILRQRRWWALAPERQERAPRDVEPSASERGQLWEPCAQCGAEPSRLPSHLCDRCSARSSAAVRRPHNQNYEKDTNIMRTRRASKFGQHGQLLRRRRPGALSPAAQQMRELQEQLQVGEIDNDEFEAQMEQLEAQQRHSYVARRGAARRRTARIEPADVLLLQNAVKQLGRVKDADEAVRMLRDIIDAAGEMKAELEPKR